MCSVQWHLWSFYISCDICTSLSHVFNTITHQILLYLMWDILPQHAATHCNTRQHTATHCDTLQYTASDPPISYVIYILLCLMFVTLLYRIRLGGSQCFHCTQYMRLRTWITQKSFYIVCDIYSSLSHVIYIYFCVSCVPYNDTRNTSVRFRRLQRWSTKTQRALVSVTCVGKKILFSRPTPPVFCSICIGWQTTCWKEHIKCQYELHM